MAAEALAKAVEELARAQAEQQAAVQKQLAEQQQQLVELARGQREVLDLLRRTGCGGDQSPTHLMSPPLHDGMPSIPSKRGFSSSAGPIPPLPPLPHRRPGTNDFCSPAQSMGSLPERIPSSRAALRQAAADRFEGRVRQHDGVGEGSQPSARRVGAASAQATPRLSRAHSLASLKPVVGFADVDRVAALETMTSLSSVQPSVEEFPRSNPTTPWSLHRRRSSRTWLQPTLSHDSLQRSPTVHPDVGDDSKVPLANVLLSDAAIRSSDPRRRAFDVVYITCLAAELIYSSYQFAVKLTKPHTSYIALMTLFVPLNLLWIFLNLRTSVLLGWRALETRREIQQHYMHGSSWLNVGWVWFDAAVTVPWDLILWSFTTTTAFRVGLLVRLPKIVQMLRVLPPASPVAERPLWIRIVFNLFFLAVLGHFAAVSWIYVTEPMQWEGWLAEELPADFANCTQDELTEKWYWQQYLASLYWATATVTSVGYGDIAGNDTRSRVLCLFWMPVGTMVLLWAGAKLTEWMVVTDPFVLQEQDKKRKLAALMENNNIPWSVQKSALEIYPMVLETSSSVYSTVIDELPRFLQDQIRMHVKLKLLRTVELFNDLSLACLSAVAEVTVEEVHPLDAVITEFGEAGDAMYFLEHGLVEVVTFTAEGDEVTLANLKSGSFFGEMALLHDNCTRSATVRTVTQCVVYALGKNGFYAVTAAFPELRKRVERAYKRRLRSLKLAKSSFVASPQPPREKGAINYAAPGEEDMAEVDSVADNSELFLRDPFEVRTPRSAVGPDNVHFHPTHPQDVHI
eukprot:TRINITY_DN1253_c0_g1_i1.p1 TRINITY_DN1253_c0_g1~~TRINITY_DN1253_c0_g1_i1.p1  ORF type:complete len:812 (+),score=253.53 TRINITY_DN1253_c0_g1_i1:47-2437(+)